MLESISNSSQSIYNFEEWLPHWLGKTEIQWMQWAYAVWQIVRCNPLTLLVLSFLPFYIARRRKEKTVVVLGASKDYDMYPEEMRAYFRQHSLRNLEIIRKENGILEILPRGSMWMAVKHCGYYYLTHVSGLCQLAKCSQLFGEDVIFVERLLPVTVSLAVGRRLSQTEAYEKIFSKHYHCGRAAGFVVPTFFNYADLNSKFWGVLSTIPILLQARNLNRFSNLLSLTIIVLDLNRSWLHNIYDNLFDRLAKFVKLGIFKKRTNLYIFFSIFSTRWRYSDTSKKHSYVASEGEHVQIRSYNKLKSLDDLKPLSWLKFEDDPSDQHICMEFVKDKASCKPLEYGEIYAHAVLQRPWYVS